MFAHAVRTRHVASFLVLLAAAGSASGSVMLGQIDTFQDGVTAFWTGGAGPTVNDTGGPLGAGDRYLEQSADGAGSGGKLSMYNREQWLGDYVSQGVNAIAMDLKNFTTGPLNMRIAFKTGTGPSAPGYSSTTPVVLPADGQWHHTVFVLDASMFTAINSPAAFNSVIGGLAQEFRVLHATSPSLTGTTISGKFGADNVAAIPAPAAGAAGMIAGVLAAARRRRVAR